ncbi:hypothetical protein RRF57_007585 [Xylaria bambusicola]|uniref:tryptophan--tRNA ligase n=1 Tax=Xylaria bambusicola TaxID=326684 RepID=A0AAN7UTY6_9PEZI
MARSIFASTHKRGISGISTNSQHDHVVIFSGIQPTGVPHLGNYLGAMRQWRRLQDLAGDKDKLLFSIVDLHAITMPQDAQALRFRRREMLAALLAIGLDPEKSTLFYQSSVMQHSELMWILSCTASMGYLGRMTQYKSKLQADNKQGDVNEAIASRLKLGLFSYPVLQAADILVHRATHVPVGDDQKQHLEFARECVTNFNYTYQKELLVSPETITGMSLFSWCRSHHCPASFSPCFYRRCLNVTLSAPSPRIMSLRDAREKMSKSATSEKSRILITSSPSEIKQRINQAVTDNWNTVTYEPDYRPGVANLLEITAQCSPEPTTPEAVADSLMGAKLSDLKARCIEAVTAELSGIGERCRELLERGGGKYLDDIEAAGAEVARQNAEETMRLVREAAGLATSR